jgi:uncharacterized protein YcbX
VTGVSISALRIHPIKAAAATSVATTEVTWRGLRDDRRWMFVDENGRFITQREDARLALVRPAIDGDALTVDAPKMPRLRVPRILEDGPRKDVVVWKSTCAAISGGREAAAWASEYLGAPSDLVCMPETTERAVSADYGRAGDVTSFADGFPILVASTSSLDDLNARMESPLPMDRFRPNVIVTGAPAWDEDVWTRVTFGAVPMRLVKGCDRCVVTTTDQTTGARGPEPLRTLATFRARDNKVYFAVNAIPDAIGALRVGDAVTVNARA